jgi:hypothetical protein
MPRRLITAGFTDARAEARLPGSPTDYELPFHEPKPASWSPWVPSHGTVQFRQLHLLRSVPPSSSPFAAPAGLPTDTGRCSPGFLPSRAFSKRASESVARKDRSPGTPVRPKAPARCRRDRSPPDQARSHQLPRKSGSTCSTDSSPLRDWPAPPLDGAPPLMTFSLRPQPQHRAFRVS